MAESRITYCNKDSDDLSWYYEDHKTQDRIEVKDKLLGNERKIYRNREKRKAELKARLDRLKFRTQMADTYNRDIFRCDQCGNSFCYIYTCNPLEGVSDDREYRQDCIDEMRSMRLSGGGPPDNARKIKGSSACI